MNQYKNIIRKYMAIPLLVLACACVLPLGADAKMLYVHSTNGNDSTSYAENNENNPWRTIGRAAWGNTSFASPNSSQAARAGDIVLISAGIYWESGPSNGNRFTVALNPVNNGTSGNPIIFRGVGLVYIRLQAGIRGGMIGCNGRNYIIWDNFQVDDYYGGSISDTGPVVFTGNCQHCQIINSDIKGHPGAYFHGYSIFGGNYRGISLEPAHNTVIRNNRIYQFRGGQNEAGVMAYDSNDNIIEHNEIYDNGLAIFIKGLHPGYTQARNLIRKNFIHDNNGGIRVLLAEDTIVSQNIVINNAGSGLWAGFFGSTRSRFINNTLYGNQIGVFVQGAELVDVHFKNNIVVGTNDAIFDWQAANPSQQSTTFNRNLYYNHARFAYYESGGTFSFATWQGTYGKDVNSLNNSNPLFVTAGSNFKLQSGSPALTLGRVAESIGGSNDAMIPAGAYITGNEVIGLLSEPSTPGSDITPPLQPLNLRIQ